MSLHAAVVMREAQLARKEMSPESPHSILLSSPLPSSAITRKLHYSLCGTQEITSSDYLSIIPIYVSRKAEIASVSTHYNVMFMQTKYKGAEGE